MISYLQTIPFSNGFKTLISIITFYYRQVVSKQQFSFKIISLKTCWMLPPIQMFDSLRKCQLQYTQDPNSLWFNLLPFWFSILFSQRTRQPGVNCLSQTAAWSEVDKPTLLRPHLSALPFTLENNEIRSFALSQSPFGEKSKHTCFRWFVMRWFDYWYTLGKEEISIDRWALYI